MPASSSIASTPQFKPDGPLANDLVTVTASLRSPRPLARYLATQLQRASGHRPAVGYRAGRHTALYRAILLPEYDKTVLQEGHDLRNHAVDAVVLGCDLPSATALENRDWKLGVRGVAAWTEAVRAAAPDTLLGLPRVALVDAVEHFEEALDGGYLHLNLSAFNWNQERNATHALDPFGVTAAGLPLKRAPAATILEKLRSEKDRKAQAEAVAHAGLRNALLEDLAQAPARFVTWLQGTVRAGMPQGGLSRHPSDRAREQLLRRFVEADPTKVVAGDEQIPPTVGVRCVVLGSRNKLDVRRAGRDGKVFQHYQAQPVVRELRVGYRRGAGGEPDRGKPVILKVTQAHELRPVSVAKGVLPELPADSALRGRPHSAREPLQ